MRFLILIAVLLLTSPSHAQLEQRIKEVSRKHYPKTGYTGVVGVIDSNRSVVVSSGFEDQQRTIPVSQYSRFSLASVTKVFTGMAVIHFIDEGVIGHHDTIGTWLPELKPALRQVTVNQLANHTASIHDFYSLAETSESLNDSTAYALLTELDTTVFEPGARYGYSNSHYLLLAMILERASGKSFESIVSELILQPYGMNDAGFYSLGERPLEGLMADGKRAGVRADVSGEAGLIVKATDMQAFGRVLVTADQPKTWLLEGLQEGRVYERDTSWTYAYGWFCTEDDRGPFCAASGKGFGALAYHRWYYEEGLYYFLLTNHEDLPPFRGFREEVATLLPVPDP